MIWLSDYLKNEYGRKYKKISIDAGFTCPNRDGKVGTGGCIFCSQQGSGDFTTGSEISVDEQIERGKKADDKYIAYFQAYTNTYSNVENLRKIYLPIAKREDIAIISIATRPDCLSEEIIALIKEINEIKPVWIELGLQTIHEKTAKYIRRGYELDVYDHAVSKLYKAGISQIITHIILGLPGESQEMMIQSVSHVCEIASRLDNELGCFGIKIQLLHVLKDTDLAKDYEEGLFECMTFDEYVNTVVKCLNILPSKMVVHRITGDGDKNKLIAPMWSTDKKKVMNSIRKGFICQNLV